MTVTMRAASPSDAMRIADILLASRAAFLPYARSPHTDDATRSWVHDILLPSESVTLATTLDRIDGFLACHSHDGVLWITQLYLDPARVGRGIGSRLLAHALDGIIGPVRLRTFQKNTGARRFYEWHGFVAIQLSDGSRNEENCPDVLYERILPR